MESNKNHAEKVAKSIINAIKKGTAPWQKPRNSVGYMPYNPLNNKNYRGINSLYLSVREDELKSSRDINENDHRWCTYKQAIGIGAQVRRGEKGTVIQYWQFEEKQTVVDERGRPVLDEQGVPQTKTVKLTNPKVFHAVVFHASQIDDMPPLQKRLQPEWNNEIGERILINSGADIQYQSGDKAVYSPQKDQIILPLKEQFKSEEDFYSTALHELAHWTGNENRLNRSIRNPFGSQEYAKEELKAEIASMMLSEKLGLPKNNLERHASYIESYVKLLEDDPLEIFRAARDAEKISLYIESFDLDQEINQSVDRARYEEMEIRNDPNASDDEKMAAKEKRKLEEYNAYHELQKSEIINEPVEYVAGRHFIIDGVVQENNIRMKEETTDTKMNKDHNKENSEKIYLAVPYKEKEVAKAMGAKWDKEQRSWYILNSHKNAGILKHKFDHTTVEKTIKLDPKEEAAQALRDNGLVVPPGHPIMDGKIHRLSAIDDSPNKQAGAYAFHVDGRPAGVIYNYKVSNEPQKWVSKGYHLSSEEKAALKAEAAVKKQEREQDAQKNMEYAAKLANTRIAKAKELGNESVKVPYHEMKNIPVFSGTYSNEDRTTLFVPSINVDGQVRSMTYINEDGSKVYAKGGEKTGCFHIVDGAMDDLAKQDVLVFAEGYATAATVTELTGKKTVATFDCYNMDSVVSALKEKFPEKPILIAGDDDKKLEKINPVTGRPGKNEGKTHAVSIANKYEGIAIFPSFPAGNDNLSDFNDMASLSEKSKNGAKLLLDNGIKQAKKSGNKIEGSEQSKKQGNKAKITQQFNGPVKNRVEGDLTINYHHKTKSKKI